MSNSYETMYIMRPDLSEEQVRQTSEKYINFIAERGARDIKIQNRGKRRLAYEIQNFQDGIYIQMNFTSTGDFVKPMERDMRLSEEVIRYLTLKLTTDSSLPAEEDAEEVDIQPSQPAPPEAVQPPQPAPVEEPQPTQPAPVEEPQPTQPAPVEAAQPTQPAPVEESQPTQPAPVEETAPTGEEQQ